MRKRSFSLLALPLLMVGTAASAADLPDRSHAPSPMSHVGVATVDWNGPYAGVYGGASWLETDTNRTLEGYNAVNQHGVAYSKPAADVSFSSKEKGRFTAGAYGGYNWQLNGSFVAGIEGDMGYNGAKGRLKASTVSVDPEDPGYGYSASGTAEQRLSGSVRGRFGYLVTPRTLLYVTGGLTVGQVKYATQESGPVFYAAANPASHFDEAFATESWSKTKTVYGWTVGAGAEGKITERWLLRGEYLYSQLDGSKLQNHQGRFGLTYKF